MPKSQEVLQFACLKKLGTKRATNAETSQNLIALIVQVIHNLYNLAYDVTPLFIIFLR